MPNIIARLIPIALLAATPALPASTAITRHASVSGLTAPARIVVDTWGVPHIFAASERDAFFLQGWNAARDRLWQIDLWRKRGLGLLSASFGPAYVAQDRAARLFLYRGDMMAEWAAYAPAARAEVEAFTAGINAYVDAVRRGGRPLPVEFRLTGSAPDMWKPEDVVRIRSHALVSNVLSEVARSRVACAAGLPADALRRTLSPPHAPVIADGLNPCGVPADVLKDYTLATEPVGFAAPPARLALLDSPDLALEQSSEGSNNWVIAAARTATGRPMLANDPHRQLGVPSLRYIVQLSAPGLDVIGAGEPALPGVSLGHNADAAFGLTIFYIDQEDLYAYDLNPADPDRYRYGAGWEPMTVVHESIPVKGEAAREVTLRFTRHGPVLWQDSATHRAFALRTVWSAPSASGYFQSSWLTHARGWNDFMAAHDHWGAPPLNLVFADRAGEIGWAASGLAPIRPNWDGLTPVPGDGRFEWKGFWKGSQLPVIKDPAAGWFATANAMNLPPDYPADTRRIGFEWADRSRIDRIDEVLSANPRVSIADSMALQTDSVSPMSRRLTALIAPLSSTDPVLAQALAMLKGWNHEEATDSAAAALYEVWAVKYLGPAVVKQTTPPAAWSLIGAGQLDAVISALEHPDARFGPDPAATRDTILLSSLHNALGELTAKLGPRMTAWTWGALHHATFTPAIAPLADPALRASMTLGPAPLPGGASTPKAATWAPADFNAISGASVRLVMDVGAWDNSMMVNTPGQSGDPADPHYRDLFPLWATGRYAPLLFSRKAVEAAAETVWVLSPAQ